MSAENHTVDVAPAVTSVRVVGRPEAGPFPAGPTDVARLSWAGDLDIASTPVLTSALRVLGDLGVRAVVVDASQVAFLDCAALGALVAADARLDGGLRLLRPSRPVRRLIELFELTDHLVTTEPFAPTTSVPDVGATIERSRGLVMGALRCTADQASKVLVSTALRHNVQVAVLADLLVAVTSSELGHPQGGPAQAVQRVLGCSDMAGAWPAPSARPVLP